jgi:hypothetical protein
MKLQVFLEHARTRDGAIRTKHNVRKPFLVCSVCGSSYPTVEKMLDCVNRPVEKGRFVVGDLVIVGGMWLGEAHDISDDDPWLAFVVPAKPKSKDHLDRIAHNYPWYVVTSLQQERHKEVASLISLMGQGSYGWNPTVEDSHHPMWKEGEVLGTALEGTGWSAEYYQEELGGATIRPPSARLRSEAKALADKGFVTLNLL